MRWVVGRLPARGLRSVYSLGGSCTLIHRALPLGFHELACVCFITYLNLGKSNRVTLR